MTLVIDLNLFSAAAKRILAWPAFFLWSSPCPTKSFHPAQQNNFTLPNKNFKWIESKNNIQELSVFRPRMCCCSACTIMIMNIVYIIVFKDGKTNLSESRGRQKNLLEQMIKDSFLQQDLHLALKINRFKHLLTVRVV